jgi:thiamine biosynthesis protein ThiI
MNYTICHYSEIGLKGKNRKFFEEKLIENIKKLTLKIDDFEFVKRISGRIIVKLTKKGIKREKEIGDSLKNIFGVAYFAFAVSCLQRIINIQEKALELLAPYRNEVSGMGLKTKKFKTFRIFTQRSKKEFPLNSQEINEKVGEYVLERLKAKKVKLENPDIACFIEIVEKYSFLYLERIKGLGGLPVGVSGKAVVLLSGGIDSPVAAFFAMKRGIKVIFLHFHAYPYTSAASIEKVKKLTKILRKYQGNSRLYLVPFGDIQKEILLRITPKLRVIFYRRLMFKIAQEIAKKENALGIFTGESVGQVASQTLENIRAIEEAVNLPVYRPLISWDKEEIIRKAREIDTFDISILPDEDCCSRFVPAHPETKAKLEEIKEAEKRLNVQKMIKTATDKSSIIKI